MLTCSLPGILICCWTLTSYSLSSSHSTCFWTNATLYYYGMFMKKYFKSKLCETIRITKTDINLYRTDKSLNSKKKIIDQDYLVQNFMKLCQMTTKHQYLLFILLMKPLDNSIESLPFSLFYVWIIYVGYSSMRPLKEPNNTIKQKKISWGEHNVDSIIILWISIFMVSEGKNVHRYLIL